MAWAPEHFCLSDLIEMSIAACCPACQKPPSSQNPALVVLECTSTLVQVPSCTFNFVTSSFLYLQLWYNFNESTSDRTFPPEAGHVDMQHPQVDIQGVTALTFMDGQTCSPVQSWTLSLWCPGGP